MADPILRQGVRGRVVDGADPGDEHEHQPFEDCMDCIECGHCHESVDENEVCSYCRGA